MAENSKIEWCDHTFNPWIGCTKISPACDNCYAERFGKRIGVKWGTGAERRRTSISNWKQPKRWNRKAEIAHKAWEKFKATHPGLTDSDLEEAGFIKPRRPRVFCASLADVFDNAISPKWRYELFDLISKTRYLDWLLLTKRIGNADQMIMDAIPEIDKAGIEWPPSNVWLGITICNQAEADRDIPKLLSVPAAKRFLSIEPMLGPIDLAQSCAKYRWIDFDGVECCAMPRRLDWVICGGETGKNARPMHPYWPSRLRNQCNAASVPFFFKQWGEWRPRSGTAWDEWVMENGSRYSGAFDTRQHLESVLPDDSCGIEKVGKKAAGRLLDGREWNEVPPS